MISKKVISQTIPTFYNDKTDFENSSENFSILTAKTNPLSVSKAGQRPQTTKMEPSIKSVNYFGYRFNPHNQRTNANSSVITNSTVATLNNSQQGSPSRKSQQSTFQKYLIDKQQGTKQHFNNNNNNSDSSTKHMISKILNGDIENIANNNKNLNKVFF